MAGKHLLGGICAVLVAVSALSAAARVGAADQGIGAADHDDDSFVIEGSWRVTVTPDAGGPPPSQAYHSYGRGGILIQSNATEGDLPGHGVWLRTGRDTFALAFEKFVAVNPITGQPGVFKVRENIRVRRDAYVGRAQAFFCDVAAANCVPVGLASTRGSRMFP